MRGGEAILDVICELFPRADLFTLLQTDFKMSPTILNGRPVHHSYLQKLMGLPKFASGYRSFLPVFPHAAESLDLSSFDLVLSNTHCVAKGVRKKPGSLHIAYVSTPMRYMWDMFDEYFGEGKSGRATAFAARMLRPYLRRWDVSSTREVDHLLANSRFVQERIRDFWGRESTVMHPFMDPAKFADRLEDPRDYYLIVSAFAPYKRIDLAIEAFKELGLRLVVIGGGQDAAKLRALARGAGNIEFLSGISTEALGEFYRKAKAFIFPGLEDFGITPLESLYNGRPVIAYGRGGVLDTVTEKTGVFFGEQSVAALVAAVREFESSGHRFRAADARARALEFTRAKFTREYSEFVAKAIAERAGSRTP